MKRIQVLMVLVLIFSLTGCGDGNNGHSDSLPESEFVYAKPAAEWDEMPLHKCIYCKGTARLVSGAWCCEDCEAVYGEEDFVEKVSFGAFKEGKWQDTYSKLCSLTIDVIDKETVSIEINWLSSEGENMQWKITGKWDSYLGMLRYEDGNGFFYMDAGHLYWVDYKDSAGYNCVFEHSAS